MVTALVLVLFRNGLSSKPAVLLYIIELIEVEVALFTANRKRALAASECTNVTLTFTSSCIMICRKTQINIAIEFNYRSTYSTRTKGKQIENVID